MSGTRYARSAAALLSAAAVAIWLPSSDVLKCIAEESPVLLGRYYLDHFFWLLVATLLLWWISFLLWVRPASLRVRVFRIVSAIGSVSLAVVILDVAGRQLHSPMSVRSRNFVQGYWPDDSIAGNYYHRPPDRVHEMTYVDRPEFDFSYPDLPPGFPAVRIRLSTDARGFRNQHNCRPCDLVTLGDSFAEGSLVSDDEVWPALLASKLGQSVYNLAVSGTRPPVYLQNFTSVGTELRPHTALFMIYEGNDLRDAGPRRGATLFNRAVNHTIKSSPLVRAIRSLMIETLGAIGSPQAVPGVEQLSWLPLSVHSPGGEQAYAFKPKRMMYQYRDREEYLQSPEWAYASATLRRMSEACRRAGTRMIIVYAPSKPHVVLPLVRERVPARGLRLFASFERRDLPPAGEFKRRLYQRLPTLETVLEEFCLQEGIGFVSPTRLLRERMAAGEQVYYTYDQHWTRLGHEAVAEAVARYLSASASSELSDSASRKSL